MLSAVVKHQTTAVVN